MQELQVFPNDEFGSIRVIVIKDETWFVGKDIATALGYVRPENAVTDRVDEDDRIFADKKLVLELGISFDYKELGQRGGWIINESGMYALIFDSKLKTAKKFKHWVTSEVLPQIRKTGEYSLNQKKIKSDVPVGEIARLSAVMDRIMVRQDSKPHDIARAFEMLCGQFGISLPENFVNVPEYVQQSLDLEGGAYHG